MKTIEQIKVKIVRFKKVRDEISKDDIKDCESCKQEYRILEEKIKQLEWVLR